MRRLFLSDVHLSPGDLQRAARLLAALEREAPRADEIYILGDLFDYWIGPKHLKDPDHREVLDRLRAITEGGVRVFFLLGNRDFYMGGFAEATGVEVVQGKTEHEIAAGSQRVYLCHGEYLVGRRGLAFRAQEFFRSRPVEWLYTRLPAFLSKRGARLYRWVSERRFLPAGRRGSRVVHLSPELLAERFRTGIDVIVCGHVHHPERRVSVIDGLEKVLFTLGDWSEGASYLVEEDGRWRLYPGASSGVPARRDRPQ
ncbi:MAG: metallophosphoesterase [Phycisphaerae bacterium]